MNFNQYTDRLKEIGKEIKARAKSHSNLTNKCIFMKISKGLYLIGLKNICIC